MPKRSNRFQKIVTFIAEQLAPLGATVKESVELPEYGLDGVSREVDVLIEMGNGNSCVRVALESRERARKDSIQWVDELIGKYIGLPVHLVLAVSSVGFSAAAKLKAELYNIKLVSPRDVVDADWPAEFHKLGIASLNLQLEPDSFYFHTTPPFPDRVFQNDLIRGNAGGKNAVDRTVREFLEGHLPDAIAGMQKHLREKFLSVYKSLEDLRRPLAMYWPVPVEGLSLLRGGACYQIDRVVFCFRAQIQHTPAKVDYRLLGENALLSSAQAAGLDLAIVQPAGALQARIFPRSVADRKPSKRQASSKTAKR